MTQEIPTHNERCKDCRQKKTVTKTGKNSLEIQCGCVNIDVETHINLPDW